MVTLPSALISETEKAEESSRYRLTSHLRRGFLARTRCRSFLMRLPNSSELMRISGFFSIYSLNPQVVTNSSALMLVPPINCDSPSDLFATAIANITTNGGGFGRPGSISLIPSETNRRRDIATPELVGEILSYWTETEATFCASVDPVFLLCKRCVAVRVKYRVAAAPISPTPSNAAALSSEVSGCGLRT